MIPRAVIYARCSTEEESQKDALVKQVAEAREWVHRKGWLLVDSYVESRSGTSTRGRLEYNRLYENLLKDTFDILVIKSQDRLMRNTRDWYLFVDRLTKSGKKLYMYLEQKFYSADDALLTGIKAILAEEYSRELSKKMNNAHHHRQKNGGTPILTSRTYGYRKIPDGRIVLVEEEAAVKRRMYELCAAGYGSRSIAAILSREGICKRNGNAFSDSDILRMLRSPLNKGTIVMNRFHYNFDTKRLEKSPREAQFVYEHKVPAIVSEELWEKANLAIDQRRNQSSRTASEEGRQGRNPGKGIFSGKLTCGLCAAPYYRSTRKAAGGKKSQWEWKCRNYLEHGRPQGENTSLGCANVHVGEESLAELLYERFGASVSLDRRKWEADVIAMVRKIGTFREKEGEWEGEQRSLEKIKERRAILMEKLLDGVISDQSYQEKDQALTCELQEIQKKLSRRQKEKLQEEELEEKVRQVRAFLKSKLVYEKLFLAVFLENVEKIRISPSYLEIFFCEEESGREASGMLRVEYGARFDYFRRKQEEREKVLAFLRENPSATAREMAGRLGLPLSGIRYQIRALRKEGRVRFLGAGGHGCWQVSGSAWDFQNPDVEKGK